MLNRKVTYRLCPHAEQEARFQEMWGLHQRRYNTALEERIRVYQETGKGLSFADQCRALTQWRKTVPALAALNAQAVGLELPLNHPLPDRHHTVGILEETHIGRRRVA